MTHSQYLNGRLAALSPPLKISVVNSSSHQRNAEATVLRQHGYLVKEVATAEEVDAISEPDFPHLFVVNFRDEEGYRLEQKIRQRSIDVGVLLVVSSVNGNHREHPFQSGADNFLYRPYVFDELLAVVRSLTRRLGANMKVGYR